ncbi:MAG: MlaD family protein, partial [Actinomycetota bacterium]
MRVSKIMLVKVIVFTVVCIVFTVALGMKLANSRLFADTYDMKAEFEDATGVLKGDAVKIAGVDVGRVTGTGIANGKAVLTFNLDQGIRLPKDSEVAIRWRNVLGQRFVYVYPGDDDAEWAEGETIPASQTNDVADIGEFLNRVGPILKAIDPEQANAFLDAVNTALASNEENVRALLDAGSSLASDLSERDSHIARTIANADTIMEAFASQDDQIASIIDDLDNVSGVLARRTNEVNQLVTNFADVQDQLDELLTTSASNIDASIGSLDSVTNTLASNKKNLARTLGSTPAGVSNYFQT